MRFSLTVATVLYVSAISLVSARGPFDSLALAQGEQAPTTPRPPSSRFDFEVRADFFAGLSGDTKRFERAMARCEEVLAQNPKHAEAMVWHGAGLIGLAGQLFSKGDVAKGMELWSRGLSEMNEAVALAPDNVGVRIPRGASLFEASRHVPEAQRAALLKLALDDYEHTLMLQKSTFARLSDHAKGELLFGLAEGWARAGDNDKARTYFTRLTQDAPSSGRIEYSRAWLDGKPPAEVGRCTGCH